MASRVPLLVAVTFALALVTESVGQMDLAEGILSEVGNATEGLLKQVGNSTDELVSKVTNATKTELESRLGNAAKLLGKVKSNLATIENGTAYASTIYTSTIDPEFMSSCYTSQGAIPGQKCRVDVSAGSKDMRLEGKCGWMMSDTMSVPELVCRPTIQSLENNFKKSACLAEKLMRSNLTDDTEGDDDDDDDDTQEVVGVLDEARSCGMGRQDQGNSSVLCKLHNMFEEATLPPYCIRTAAQWNTTMASPPSGIRDFKVFGGNQTFCVQWKDPAHLGTNAEGVPDEMHEYMVYLKFNQDEPSILSLPEYAWVPQFQVLNDTSLELIDTLNFTQLGALTSVHKGDKGWRGDLGKGNSGGKITKEEESEMTHRIIFNKNLLNTVSYDVALTGITLAGIQIKANQFATTFANNTLTGDCELALYPTEQWYQKPQWIALIAVGVALIVFVAACAVWIVLQRRYLMEEKLKEDAEEQLLLNGNLRQFMGELIEADASDARWLDAVREGACDSLVFVFTDIQGSTAMSDKDAVAFQEMQDAHDAVLREGVAHFNGYEVDTEGDAFRVIFPNTSMALNFCLRVQEELYLTNWTERVLSLDEAGEACNGKGEVCFRGPRVRMGIHRATRDEFEVRLHPLTKKLVFRGKGYKLAKHLGDCGSGGQVLLSEPSLREIIGTNADVVSVATAGFPMFEDLGVHVISDKYDEHVNIFQASPTFWTTLSGQASDTLVAMKKRSGWTVVVSQAVEKAYGLMTCVAQGLRVSEAAQVKEPDKYIACSYCYWPQRYFPPIESQFCMEDGLGRNWIQAPDKEVSLVCVGLRPLYEAGRTMKIDETKEAKMDGGGFGRTVSEGVMEDVKTMLYDTLSSMGDIFLGFQIVNEAGGSKAPLESFSLKSKGARDIVIRIAFASPANAARFALAAQVALVSANWPIDVYAFEGFEKIYDTATGFPLYRGPRCSIAIHHLAQWKRGLGDNILQAPFQQQGSSVSRFSGSRRRASASIAGSNNSGHGAIFGGGAPSPEGVEMLEFGSARIVMSSMLTLDRHDAELQACEELCRVARSGQIVVSERAWEVMQMAGGVPGGPRVVDMGTYKLPHFPPNGTQVIELTPMHLAGRAWEGLRQSSRHRRVSPGARQAPGYRELNAEGAPRSVSILFTFVHAPALPDDANAAASFEALVQTFSKHTRMVLLGGGFGGYECQEVDPGNFMLAFDGVEDAVGFGVQLLADVSGWPIPTGLDPTTIYPGEEAANTAALGPLRIRVGVATGVPSAIKTHPVTGRADYFGSVVNLAARIANSAQGGELLFEAGGAGRGAGEMAGCGVVQCRGGRVFKGIRDGAPVEVWQALPEKYADKVSMSSMMVSQAYDDSGWRHSTLHLGASNAKSDFE